MADLVEYISKEIEKGYAKEDIEAVLIKAGYSAQEVKESFSQVKITPAVADRPRLIDFIDRKYIIFTVLAIGILLFGIVALLSSMGGKEMPKPVSSNISKAYHDCIYPDHVNLATCQAWATGNMTYCEELSDSLPGDRLLCDTLALSKQAWLENDSKICDVESNARAGCLAFIEADPSGCTALGETEWIEVCGILAQIKRNVESSDKALCQGLFGQGKELCESIIDDSQERCILRFDFSECQSLR